MGMIYKWKPNVSVGIPPQEAGERLEQIRQKNGFITPRMVVRDARSKSSPLHNAFEWDNEKAAELYREDRARYILRSIIIASDGEYAKPVRLFVNIRSSEAERESVYQNISVAMADPEMRQQVLTKAFEELEQWEARYKELKELADIFAAAGRAKRKLEMVFQQ